MVSNCVTSLSIGQPTTKLTKLGDDDDGQTIFSSSMVEKIAFTGGGFKYFRSHFGSSVV